MCTCNFVHVAKAWSVFEANAECLDSRRQRKGDHVSIMRVESVVLIVAAALAQLEPHLNSTRSMHLAVFCKSSNRVQ